MDCYSTLTAHLRYPNMDWTSITPIIIAIIGSQAFVEVVKWLTTRKKPTPSEKLLIAIAQDRIVYIGTSYIKQGYITHDQLKTMIGIFTPYHEAGGDGMADLIMDRCRALPIKEGNT